MLPYFCIATAVPENLPRLNSKSSKVALLNRKLTIQIREQIGIASDRHPSVNSNLHLDRSDISAKAAARFVYVIEVLVLE